MKIVKFMALISSFALLISLNALAAKPNRRAVNLHDQVKVGNTQLQPGTYRVEWQGSGPVQVSFVQFGKTVATAPATVKMNDSTVTQDDVVTDPTNSNVRALREIDFTHGKDALIFHRAS